MRIHFGHHFYGAGNIGDDFMLAGFLCAISQLAPGSRYTGSVPFPLDPLRARFPGIEWLPYDDAARDRAVATCDAWLGLGGSPFQSAQSRWFVDHLTGEAAFCRRHAKRMFYLGVGVQTETELEVPEVQDLVARAAGIWARDGTSAERIARNVPSALVRRGADLAHIFFRDGARPPKAAPGRVTLVANFDYGSWPGAAACLEAIDRLGASEHVWLSQEKRELPGGERALYATLPERERERWKLVVPDEPNGEAGAFPRRQARECGTLSDAMSRWPSGEWLITSRYHAALAGAWAGSKIVVIGTNEKLRAAADELAAPVIAPDADADTASSALAAANVPLLPTARADVAFNACREFVKTADSVPHGA